MFGNDNKYHDLQISATYQVNDVVDLDPIHGVLLGNHDGEVLVEDHHNLVYVGVDPVDVDSSGHIQSRGGGRERRPPRQ